MGIKINAPFTLGAAVPVDDRDLITKADMLTINDNVWPDHKLTVCSDDGKVYLYSKSNESDPETGKFRLFSTDSLTDTQLKAVNSGITSDKVSEYDSYATTKQDALSQEQLESVNSTITKSKVDSFEALKTSKQDSLTDDQLSAVNSGITATKLTKIDDAISKIPENITTQGNEFNNANQLVKLDENSKLPAIDGSLLTNLPTSSYGIKGDYFSKYGITKCQNGLIKTTLGSKEVVVLAGIECFMPGATTKITIASNITYEVKATTKTTLFLAGAEIIEAEAVFYQETEPEDGSSTYVAWYNPKANEWKFKSNDTGNVFRTVRATPIADVYVDGSNITRIDYIGYRVFNDTIYATKDDLDTVSNSLSTKQDALTTEQLNAVNSGITETNFNELNTEVETIKNDQETLGNDLGTLSNTVGLKDDLPDTSKSITQNISSISTKVSGLIKDDESSATTTYSSSKILGLIGDIHTFDALVVDALPDVGVEKTIYFVPATTTKDKNIYDEYLYINNAWELIGSTQVDLSNYLKIDGSNGTEAGINVLLNLISAGEDDIFDTSNILFENTAFKKKTALSFVNYLKGKIIDDTTASTSTVYSSAKIEEIKSTMVTTTTGAKVESMTQAEYNALTTKDSKTLYNITDKSSIINDFNEASDDNTFSASLIKNSFLTSQATFTVSSNEDLAKWATNASGNDYTSVYIAPGTYTLESGSVNLTAAGTKIVEGHPNAKLVFKSTNAAINTNYYPALYYTTKPDSQEYKMTNVIVDVTGMNATSSNVYAVGFYNCINMLNCYATAKSTGTKSWQAAYSYYACSYLINCQGASSGANNGNAYTFSACTYLTNCIADETVYPATYDSQADIIPYAACSYLINCQARSTNGYELTRGYFGCNYLTGCSATVSSSTTTSTEISGFCRCARMVNCQASITNTTGKTLTNVGGFINSSMIDNCVSNDQIYNSSYVFKCNASAYTTSYVDNYSTACADTSAGGYNHIGTLNWSSNKWE